MNQIEIEPTPAAIKLLGQTLDRAARCGLTEAGTEHLLFSLVKDDLPAGEAIARKSRAAGSLMGLIVATEHERWVSADDEVTPSEFQVDAALREAEWTARQRKDEDWVCPVPTPSLRTCVRKALALGGSPEHLALALLDMPDSRAMEALRLRRIDHEAAAETVRRLEVGKPESRAVTLLRKAGALDEKGMLLVRTVSRWFAKGNGYGSPVLFAIRAEAVRQAVRHGRAEAEPIDLLLAVQALDRQLTQAGRELPPARAAFHTSVDVTAPTPVQAVRPQRVVRLGTAAERAMSAAVLLAADRRDPEVGTTHLVEVLQQV